LLTCARQGEITLHLLAYRNEVNACRLLHA
jgi:hypothetical protein